ncbi:hypothetical protein OG948_33625 [Embleya sp. NBC_00888]|nr:hypothetical protein OG948_33625 [Embleya sp. NBC_00888]
MSVSAPPITGVYPTLQPCATSRAAIVIRRSASRLSEPVIEVNARSAPVHENTSRIASGRSTRGIIDFTAARSSTRLGGSGSGSSAARCSRPSSPNVACVFTGNRDATSRYVPSNNSARARSCSCASSGRPRLASTVGRVRVHAAPDNSFARGSPHFEELRAKISRRRSIQWKCSNTQNTYAFHSTHPGSTPGADSTRRRHDPDSSDRSISEAATFLRPSRSGSDRNPASTGAPSGVAPKSTTPVSVGGLTARSR